MRPTRVHENQTVLRSNREDVLDLPVIRVEYDGGDTALVTAWTPEGRERRLILEGHPVYVSLLNIDVPPALLVTAERAETGLEGALPPGDEGRLAEIRATLAGRPQTTEARLRALTRGVDEVRRASRAGIRRMSGNQAATTTAWRVLVETIASMCDVALEHVGAFEGEGG